MLRPYTPNRKESRSADPRSVRGGAPSFAVTRTLAVDNNPALKAPKSGNGGPFSELGAGHWNSSCRSCVTIFFIDSPAPVFHHAGTAKKESDKGSDVAIMSSKSVAVPASSVTMLPKSITTAIGIGLSEELGGIVTITVAVIIITGILGNVIADTVFRIFKIKNPLAKGLALGTASHAIGTARAIEMGPVEGAMSSLAVAVAGLLTVVFVSGFAQLI